MVCAPTLPSLAIDQDARAIEILERWSAAIDRTRNCTYSGERIEETRAPLLAKGQPLWHVTQESCTRRADGALDLSERIWGPLASADAPRPLRAASYIHFIWTPKERLYQYNEAAAGPDEWGRLLIRSLGQKEIDGLRMWSPTAPLDCQTIVDGRTVKLPDAMIGSKPRLVSDREIIRGSRCALIDVKMDDANYKVWLDTEHDFNLSRMERSFGIGNAAPGGGKYPIPNFLRGWPTIVSGTATTEVMTFQKVDQGWVPTTATTIASTTFGDGSKSEGTVKLKRSNITIDPDFSNAFRLDFPNGTTVEDSGGQKSLEWRDGRVVPAKHTSEPKGVELRDPN
jgi:hypothetical protein